MAVVSALIAVQLLGSLKGGEHDDNCDPFRGLRAPAVRLSALGKPRKRNPAPGFGLVVRLQPHELDLLDNWMIEQDDIPATRQAAIRRLIAMVCGTESK